MATVLGFLLPIVLLSDLVEGYVLVRWGGRAGPFERMITYNLDVVVRYASIQLILGLVMVGFGAVLIKWITDSFHLQPRFTQCFNLAAYGMSPVFLARFLHAIPTLNSWIIWAVGALGCIYILYQGIGIVLEPDQTKGFGLYLLSGLVFTILSGIAQLMASAILSGGVNF
ncbi:MAG: YIP1 family protein [Candidatus Omnitrophica bacterium]|nr:YIP1 family protein [Candidatus Omnitrophota bacterium]